MGVSHHRCCHLFPVEIQMLSSSSGFCGRVLLLYQFFVIAYILPMGSIYCTLSKRFMKLFIKQIMTNEDKSTPPTSIIWRNVYIVFSV